MIPPIAALAEKGLLLWLAAMALIVGWRCLTGDINLSGVLAHDSKDLAEGRPAPERVQLLLGFAFALVAYARLALSAQDLDGTLPVHLPEVPTELMLLFAGSHSIYLAGKLGRTITRRGLRT